MAKNSSSINTDFIISFFLPDGMIDWFEVVNIKEESNRGTAQADVLYNSVLHIYLDERDTRSGESYLDADNRNVILNQYPLTADGTKMSVEFGLFFKDSDGQASIDSSVISKILSY